VHADQLKRPLKMTDLSKAVVWDAIYKPFGEIVSTTGPASNNLRFPGQYFLIEDGLHYNWYRHYDPTIGRYVQPDRLPFIDGPSLFEYVRSSPMAKADPSGRQTELEFPNLSRRSPSLPPDVFSEWRRYAEPGMRGLWNFILSLCPPSGAPSRPFPLFPLSKCLDYCVMGSPEQMLKFCQKYTVPGTRNAQRCFSAVTDLEAGDSPSCENKCRAISENWGG
jgi:RHS repeat-associated protein